MTDPVDPYSHINNQLPPGYKPKYLGDGFYESYEGPSQEIIDFHYEMVGKIEEERAEQEKRAQEEAAAAAAVFAENFSRAANRAASGVVSAVKGVAKLAWWAASPVLGGVQKSVEYCTGKSISKAGAAAIVLAIEIVVVNGINALEDKPREHKSDIVQPNLNTQPPARPHIPAP